MFITLSPTRSETPISVTRAGDALIINGVTWPLADPASACPWFITPPVLDGTEWHVALLLPHGAGAGDETLFPAPVTVTDDGPVPLPPYAAPQALDIPPDF